MRFEILGWESEGLRCPDMKVDLHKDGVIPKVSIIQMPNGTGKTTTLDMLKVSLSGQATKWDGQKIRGYRRPGEDKNKGKFIVNLRVDGKLLTFELILNYDDERVQYRTTSPGSGGVKLGWSPSTEVRRFLDDRFINLFIFDGELAERLLDPKDSEATKAIDALCQLYLLEDMKNLADEAWQKATKGTSAKTDVGHTKWQKKVANLKKNIISIQDKREKAAVEVANLNKEISKLDQNIKNHISTREDLRKEYEEKKSEEDTSKKDVDDISLELMNIMRKPHLMHQLFSDSLIELKANLDRLKLPASTSKQFFDELIEEDTCVCGRPIDETARNEIRERAKNYLGEEIAGVLNALKQDISKETINDVDDINSIIKILDEAVDKHRIAQTTVRVLHQKLIDEGDEELQKWQAELEAKKERKDKLKNLLEAIDKDDEEEEEEEEETICLKSLHKQLRQAEKKLSEISGTIDLKNRTDIFRNILDTAVKKSRVRLNRIILKECNERLRDVLSQDPIQIEKIERSLTLLNQDGASAGQTLAVGYIFLTTLLNRGHHKFPLIVDSPAHNLSIKVRREIGKIVPILCDQFITFTTSSEREGFVPSLQKSSDDKIKYFTLFRKTIGTEYLINNLPKEGVIQSTNGVLVDGEQYFNLFDIEQEIERA